MSTVQQSGGDYSTLDAALDAAIADETITIQGSWSVDDTAACTVADNNITIQIASGNASYHNGKYLTSDNHYRLVVNSAGSHCILVNNTGCVIDGLAISQASSGSSDEGIRMANDDGTLTVKNCIVFAATGTSDQDGLYAGALSCTFNVQNCIVYSFDRAGLHPQISSGTHAQIWNINSCSVWDCVVDGEPDGGGISALRTASGATYTINIFNTWMLDCDGNNSETYNERDSLGTATWSIVNCIDNDGSIDGRDGGAVGALTSRAIRESTAGGDEVLVVDITGADVDLHLVDDATNNDARYAHSNTSGAGLSLPTLDIDAEIRDTASGKVDIGADAFPSAAGPAVIVSSEHVDAPVGKNNSHQWWVSSQSRWDGLIPKDDGTNDNDWYVVKDIEGAQTFHLEIEGRQSGRPTIVWDDANEILYVYSSHLTTAKYWKVDYTTGSDTYAIDTDVNGVTVTDCDTDNIDDTQDTVITPNGKAWVACMNGNGLLVQQSSSADLGQTWLGSAAVVKSNTLSRGSACCGYSGTKFIVFGIEDQSIASAALACYSIDEDDDPSVDGNWTDESGSLPALDGGDEGDNHCAMAVDSDGRIYIVIKTGLSDIKAFSRSAAGSWDAAMTEVWATGNDWSRPAICVKKKDGSSNEEILIIANQLSGGNEDVGYKTHDVGALSSFSSETLLYTGTPTWINPTLPQFGFIASSTEGLMTIATDETTPFDFHYIKLAITAAAGRRRIIRVG